MSVKHGRNIMMEELAALTALVQNDTAYMCAENQQRAHRGEQVAYVGDCWHDLLVQRLRIVLEQRNVIEKEN